MYEYFDVFMKLCTSFDDCILVSKMQRTYDTCKLGSWFISWWYFKEFLLRACITTCEW